MKIIKTVSDGRKTVIIYEDENGTVFSSDGNFKSDRNKVEFDDELDRKQTSQDDNPLG